MTTSYTVYNSGMCAPAIHRVLLWTGLQLGLLAVSSAQTLPATDLQALADEDLEILPKYEIEVIAFAYHDFDPVEEQFAEIPRGTLLDLLNPTLRETTERAETNVSGTLSESLRSIDNEQPTLIPTEPSERIDSIGDLFGSQDSGDPLGPEIFGVDETGLPAATEPFASETSLDAPNTAPTEVAAVDAFSTFEGEFSDPSLDDAGEDDALAAESTWYRILTSEELELTDTADRLERLDAYSPLIHGGWEQEGFPEEEAIPFNLSLLGGFNPLGTVQLHVSRFLHVTVALLYQTDRPSGELLRPVGRNLEEISFPPRFSLHIQRRTRSGEVHFFDHPAFGVLVLVRPAPEEPEISEQDLSPAA